MCECVFVCLIRRGKGDFDGDEYTACLGTVSTNKVPQGDIKIQTLIMKSLALHLFPWLQVSNNRYFEYLKTYFKPAN